MGQTEYPDSYMEMVFYAWYEGGKKVGNNFLNSLPASPGGRQPSKATVIDWINTKGWIERADALDAEASRALDSLMIDKRKKMYEEQVRVANELVEKGMEYLNEKGIQSDASALRAIDLGLATQRVSTGMAEAYIQISKMSDDQLDKELKKLLGGGKIDSVDADEIIEEE